MRPCIIVNVSTSPPGKQTLKVSDKTLTARSEDHSITLTMKSPPLMDGRADETFKFVRPFVDKVVEGFSSAFIAIGSKETGRQDLISEILRQSIDRVLMQTSNPVEVRSFLVCKDHVYDLLHADNHKEVSVLESAETYFPISELTALDARHDTECKDMLRKAERIYHGWPGSAHFVFSLRFTCTYPWGSKVRCPYLTFCLISASQAEFTAVRTLQKILSHEAYRIPEVYRQSRLTEVLQEPLKLTCDLCFFFSLASSCEEAEGMCETLRTIYYAERLQCKGVQADLQEARPIITESLTYRNLLEGWVGSDLEKSRTSENPDVETYSNLYQAGLEEFEKQMQEGSIPGTFEEPAQIQSPSDENPSVPVISLRSETDVGDALETRSDPDQTELEENKEEVKATVEGNPDVETRSEPDQTELKERLQDVSGKSGQRRSRFRKPPKKIARRNWKPEISTHTRPLTTFAGPNKEKVAEINKQYDAERKKREAMYKKPVTFPIRMRYRKDR